MGSRTIEFAENEFYHVYNRGVEKRIIYLDDRDYGRFKQLLYLANSSTPLDLRSIKRESENVFEYPKEDLLVAIGAYCLMPNHFHMLLTPLQEGGVSRFMNKLGTAYSMYFNRKYERTGGLFEGKFKAKMADSDEYLKYLFSYIHLNPVKLIQSDWKEKGIHDWSKAYEYIKEFPHASLFDFFNSRSEFSILDTKSFPEYFKYKGDMKSELIDWLQYDEFV